MSSTPKGALWRPALLAMLEDTGAIEARGELAHRAAVMKRYESSPLFRSMLLKLTWILGFALFAVAIVATILISVLEESVAFGVGWGVPWISIAILSLFSVWFVKKSLKEERAMWNKGPLSGSNTTPADAA